jgi:hypothetical protein
MWNVGAGSVGRGSEVLKLAFVFRCLWVIGCPPGLCTINKTRRARLGIVALKEDEPFCQTRPARRRSKFHKEHRYAPPGVPVTDVIAGARLLALAACPLLVHLHAQELIPRAYVITPLHSNAVNLIWSFYDGGFELNGAIPVSGALGVYHLAIFNYYHSFGFFGRSANISASLPYGAGTFQATVLDARQQYYRSGLVDANFRLSVNLLGGPAMPVEQFAKWKQKVLLGASLKVVAPTGQYDPTKIINWGINRWAFKPEFGYSERWGQWVLDGYGGVWFYTTNEAYYSTPRPKPQVEGPILSFESHLSYDLGKPRFWVSLDSNFWMGGTTSTNGVQNPATKQTSSRIGASFSFPVNQHQSIKIGYSAGVYDHFGGNYQNVSVAWQYAWRGRPQ